MNGYKSKEWAEYRDEIIRLDDSRCTKCGRGRQDGAILQVHHDGYIPGRALWEYAHDRCATLCSACHAREHGKRPPCERWECVGSDDLGDLDGNCEYCGTEIRYVYLVRHENWPSLEVGTICCDSLTGTTDASEYIGNVKKRERRLGNFLNSPRWRVCGTALEIRQADAWVAVIPDGAYFCIRIAGKSGRLRFSNIDDAKRHIFHLCDNGSLIKYTIAHRASA
jgi:hypothetical protein